MKNEQELIKTIRTNRYINPDKIRGYVCEDEDGELFFVKDFTDQSPLHQGLIKLLKELQNEPAETGTWKFNCPDETSMKKGVDILVRKGYVVKHVDGDICGIIIFGDLHNIRVILGEAWDVEPTDIGAEVV